MRVACFARVAYTSLAPIRRRRVGASSGLSPAATRFGAGAKNRECAVYCNVVQRGESERGYEVFFDVMR